MNLWVVCVVVLLMGVEGIQWLGQFSWPSLVDFSQPWMVVAGVGLAIASIRSLRNQALPSDPSQETPKVSAVETSLIHPSATVVDAPVSSSARRTGPKPSGSASISFDIRKPDIRKPDIRKHKGT